MGTKLRLVAVLAIAFSIAGCFVVQREIGIARRAQAEADIAEPRAEITQMYKECLKRNQDDPNVDCSEYRAAVEIYLKEPK